LSIAWSLAEYLHNQPGIAAKTLFATHYHELNELENMYERIVNYNVQVKEHEDKVIFLRKLAKGGADHSYGIQVASMAGLPPLVIERAKEILSNLESHSLDITNSNGKLENGAAKKRQASQQATQNLEKQDEISQMSLFQAQLDPKYETLKNKLEGCDPNRMTPVESLLFLTEIKRLMGN
ncbi:MAG: DNA mismatch repair protein MutS, partial [Balneolales bacterium]